MTVFLRLSYKCPVSCQICNLNIWIFLSYFLMAYLLLVFGDVCTLTLKSSNLHAPSNGFWGRRWHPTPVPGKSHGWSSLGGLQYMGSWRVRHNWAISLSLFTFMHWRRKWQPTPVFLPGESQGWGSLVGCCLWGRRVGHNWSDLAAAAAAAVMDL